MLTTMETKNMKRTTLTLIGLLALVLSSTGVASARDYDRARLGHAGARHNDTGAVRAAYRADVSLDHHGAVINHYLDVGALFVAVAGDYHFAHALDRRGDQIEHRYHRRGDRIVHRAKAAKHRHHGNCRHHRSTWRANRHHLKHAHSHSHGRGHGKGHGGGHRGRKRNGHKDHY